MTLHRNGGQQIPCLLLHPGPQCAHGAHLMLPTALFRFWLCMKDITCHTSWTRKKNLSLFFILTLQHDEDMLLRDRQMLDHHGAGTICILFFDLVYDLAVPLDR